MRASPALAVLALALVLVVRPSALAAALPVLMLWAVAPLIAHELSRPVPARRQELEAEDRAFLRLIARKTWRYFETFAGDEDHGLPPDNFQEVPDPRVAHRTSPTNIGMGLLATPGRPRSRLHPGGRARGANDARRSTPSKGSNGTRAIS